VIELLRSGFISSIVTVLPGGRVPELPIGAVVAPAMRPL
jgi:hypothetical protein